MKLFDTRTKKSVLTVEHGHPVESVVMFPAGGIFLSAGQLQFMSSFVSSYY